MAVSQLQPDEFLHAWERGYSLTDGLWDDASAVRALHELRAVRDTVKKKAAEAKKKAAEAKRTARAPKRKQSDVLQANSNSRRVNARPCCSRCGQEDHRQPTCPNK